MKWRSVRHSLRNICGDGLGIEGEEPVQAHFTHSIANGYYGYMPTPEQHQLGGYETWLGTNRLEVEASGEDYQAAAA